MIDSKYINDNDVKIFKFLKPYYNNKLSEMSGADLLELMSLIDDYYIELRKQLGLNQKITFGLELEFENALKNIIDRKLDDAFPNGDWVTKRDATLHNGAEIASPILRDNKICWENLNKVCSIVEPLASIGTKSGGHIHIGTQTIGNDRESWLNFIKLWSVYENIIFRFSYGEYLTPRQILTEYAKPMTKEFWEKYEKLKAKNASLESIIFSLSYSRYQAVNFENVNKSRCNYFGDCNTIEFRCPNGTINPVIWQNNVNLFANLLLYSKSSDYDENTIEKRRDINKDKFSTLEWYNEIYLQQSLELCDMLFENNIDKINFLRQYLKSFEIGRKELEKAKTFTKK